MKYIEKIPHIILSVIFVATFLTIFYFTYVCKVENEIVEKQIIFLADNLYDETINYLPNDIKKRLKENFLKINIPDFSGIDDEISKKNKAIFTKTIYVLAALNVIGLIVSFLIAKKNDLNITNIILKNFLILVFIAGTELAFLKIFIVDYISVDPNKVKLQILNKLFPN